MELVVGIAVGLLTGCISSFGVWWLLTHRVAPSVELSTVIAHAEAGDYRINLKNQGARDAYELRLEIVIRIPNLAPGSTFSSLILRDRYITRVKAGGAAWYSVTTKAIDEEVLHLYEHQLPAEFVNHLRGRRLTDLEMVFALHPDARIRARLFGNDVFSGARTLVERSYGADDVVEGVFAYRSLDVVTIENYEATLKSKGASSAPFS